MKKCIVTIICSILLFGCGISNKDKDYMQTILNNELHRAYDYELMVNAEISKIREVKEASYGEKYKATFKCSLTPLNTNDKIYLWGEVAFDKNKSIVFLPERFGKNKKYIDISLVQINENSVPASEIDTCKYILDMYMNRNKLLGNE